MRKFRRATHTVDGVYLEEKFKDEALNQFQRRVWKAHGNIVHVLDSKNPVSFDRLLELIREDVTNYSYHPADLEIWVDGAALPTPEAVALSLLRCIEAGFVEVV